MTAAEATAPDVDRSAPGVLTRPLGVAVVAVTIAVAAVLGKDLWFFSDDWNIYAQWPSGRLLEPFNSHLSLVPIGVYQALFHTVGVGSYVPYRVVGLVAYALLGLMVLRYSRTRLGDLGAALATAAVLWNSGGSTNVMFPFLMNFSLPIAALAAIWWHLDRADERRIRDELWASWWLILALATSGLGLMVAVAVGVELLWRRPPLRRWAVLAPGPALWLAWYAGYGVDSPPSGGVRSVVSYAARMLLGGFASLVGGTRWLGVPLIVGFGALVAASIMKGTFGARALASLAAPVAFAGLTAVSRTGVVPAIPPDELRYQWTIGAFLVLAAVELLRTPTEEERGRTADHGFEGSPLISLAGRLAIAIAVLANGALLVDSIGDWDDSVEVAVPGVRDNLWVAEAAARSHTLDRGRQLPVSYVKVTTGEYADAVDELGSTLDGLDPADYGGTPDSRRAADQAFVDDFGIELRVQPAATSSFAGCDATPIGSDPLEVEPPTVVIAAGERAATVKLSLFTDTDPSAIVLGTIPAGDRGGFELPSLDGDRPPGGYRITVSGDARLLDCSS